MKSREQYRYHLEQKHQLFNYHAKKPHVEKHPKLDTFFRVMGILIYLGFVGSLILGSIIIATLLFTDLTFASVTIMVLVLLLLIFLWKNC